MESKVANGKLESDSLQIATTEKLFSPSISPNILSSQDWVMGVENYWLCVVDLAGYLSVFSAEKYRHIMSYRGLLACRIREIIR